MTSKKWIFWLIVLGLACGSGYWYFLKPSPRSTQATFDSFTVKRGTIEQIITATGTVSPQNRVEVKAPISGRIESLLVAEGDSVKAGQVIAWLSSTERSALLDLARIKGPKALAHWEDLYKPTPLIAPISGTVISRKMEGGQTFTPSDPILVLADRLLVDAQVDETDIGKLKLGQTAIISLDAYPNVPIPAKITHIAYEAQTVNNVTIYEVELTPTQPLPAFFKSGMSADVSFTIMRHADVLMIPQLAIESRGRGHRVITDISTPKPSKTRIRVGLSDGQNTEVLSGLNEGDTVYVSKTPLKKRKDGNSPFMPGGSRGGGRNGGGGRNR
ncbi:MAG: HlyD family efflux transporter periplasmic adaptor subunit [Candidatus Margulisiibacteriota bacterium]